MNTPPPLDRQQQQPIENKPIENKTDNKSKQPSKKAINLGEVARETISHVDPRKELETIEHKITVAESSLEPPAQETKSEELQLNETLDKLDNEGLSLNDLQKGSDSLKNKLKDPQFAEAVDKHIATGIKVGKATGGIELASLATTKSVLAVEGVGAESLAVGGEVLMGLGAAESLLLTMANVYKFKVVNDLDKIIAENETNLKTLLERDKSAPSAANHEEIEQSRKVIEELKKIRGELMEGGVASVAQSLLEAPKSVLELVKELAPHAARVGISSAAFAAIVPVFSANLGVKTLLSAMERNEKLEEVKKEVTKELERLESSSNPSTWICLQCKLNAINHDINSNRIDAWKGVSDMCTGTATLAGTAMHILAIAGAVGAFGAASTATGHVTTVAAVLTLATYMGLRYHHEIKKGAQQLPLIAQMLPLTAVSSLASRKEKQAQEQLQQVENFPEFITQKNIARAEEFEKNFKKEIAEGGEKTRASSLFKKVTDTLGEKYRLYKKDAEQETARKIIELPEATKETKKVELVKKLKEQGEIIKTSTEKKEELEKQQQEVERKYAESKIKSIVSYENSTVVQKTQEAIKTGVSFIKSLAISELAPTKLPGLGDILKDIAVKEIRENSEYKKEMATMITDMAMKNLPAAYAPARELVSNYVESELSNNPELLLLKFALLNNQYENSSKLATAIRFIEASQNIFPAKKEESREINAATMAHLQSPENRDKIAGWIVELVKERSSKMTTTTTIKGMSKEEYFADFHSKIEKRLAGPEWIATNCLKEYGLVDEKGGFNPDIIDMLGGYSSFQNIDEEPEAKVLTTGEAIFHRSLGLVKENIV